MLQFGFGMRRNHGRREHRCCRSGCGGLDAARYSAVDSIRSQDVLLDTGLGVSNRIGACTLCRSTTDRENVVVTPVCWIAPRCDPRVVSGGSQRPF